MPAELVIYDGRVGAALGLLAREFLKARGHQGDVPEALKFAWGASRRIHEGQQNERNPSEGSYKFPRLFGAKQNLVHAKMMAKASFLLTGVSQILSGERVTLQKLEQALFMIGYQVSGQSSSTSAGP